MYMSLRNFWIKYVIAIIWLIDWFMGFTTCQPMWVILCTKQLGDEIIKLQDDYVKIS